MNPQEGIVYSEGFQRARRQGVPLVALESAVITHGLPHPHNLSLALGMESEVRARGAYPATIGLLDGEVVVGLSPDQIERLASVENPAKVSLRDFAAVMQAGGSGGTTVAGTMQIAYKAEIRVFATGGIGGVHHGGAGDVSTDLPQLARTPMVVVCAGAKAILDLPATVEHLETHGVPVLGYGTDSFPGFYARDSGLPVSQRVDSAQAVREFAGLHWGLGLESAVLVVVPPPEESALPVAEVEAAIAEALAAAERAGVRGQQVTPFLLQQVSELTDHASIEANIALLKQNAGVAAEIAAVFATGKRKYFV